MNILIVGFGYSGKRFYTALTNGATDCHINVAYVNKKKVEINLTYFKDVKHALNIFKPEIIIITTTDNQHIHIIEMLSGYDGFIICEKPLAVPGDHWELACKNLKKNAGFALNLVERYSFTTRYLREFIKKQKLSLVRAHFIWGKNRINDYRATCGVMSEVIHPIDLISWILDDNRFEIKHLSGVRSDFSISGREILDTVLLSGEINACPVTGYSSFVNIQRQRNMDFTFTDPQGEILHARIIYDTPEWDSDDISIWTVDKDGKENIIFHHSEKNENPNLLTVLKLSKLCRDVVDYVAEGKLPSQPFPDLESAVRLQKMLDQIERETFTPVAANYIRVKERTLLPKEGALELLG